MSTQPKSMLELLLLDEQLFRLINSTWQHPVLDAILPLWRNKFFWIPLYLFIAFFSVKHLKIKGLYLMLALVATIGISDTISSRVIKKNVERLRPCRTEHLKADVHLLVNCGSGYSFTSSHATNHFAIAFFLIIALGKWLKRWRNWFILWAFGVAYSQVYVGVHFPLDVLCGGLLGAFIGWGMGRLFVRFVLSENQVSLNSP